jgi:hypothetical protein
MRLTDKGGERVAEFQPYLPSNGTSYSFGEALGTYRGLTLSSGGAFTGTGDHPYQCTSFTKDFVSQQYGVSLKGTVMVSIMAINQQYEVLSNATIRVLPDNLPSTTMAGGYAARK